MGRAMRNGVCGVYAKAHYENTPIHIEIISSKNLNFQIKNCYIFHISAQNIDCGYSLETPR